MWQHLCHAVANDAFLSERNAPALHPVFGFNSSPRTRKSKSVSVSKKHQPLLHPHINQQLSSINATLSSSLKKCCFLKWLRGLAWNQASVIHVNHEFSKFSHAANWDRAGHFIPSMQATHSKLSGKARQDDFVWKNYWQDEQWKMSMRQ